MALELLAGYVVACLLRKLKRVATRTDEEIDHVVDTALDRLYAMVTEKLGTDPALARLEEEAAEDGETPRTRQRVALAIEAAAEADPEFASRLEELAASLRQAGVQAGRYGVAAGGDVSIRASTHGVAAGVIHGSVSTGNPQAPDTPTT